jgi:hypothetical protein
MWHVDYVLASAIDTTPDGKLLQLSAYPGHIVILLQNHLVLNSLLKQ